MYFKYFISASLIAGPIFAAAASTDWDRVEFFHPQHVKMEHALLVQSLGKTKIEIRWNQASGVRSLEVIDDKGNVIGSSGESGLVVTLAEKGLHRIVPRGPEGDVTLATKCLENCFREEISPQTAWKRMEWRESLHLVPIATGRLAELTQDEDLRKKLTAGLIAHFQGRDLKKRFPVLPPLHEIPDARGILGAGEVTKAPVDKVLRGDFEKLLDAAKREPLAEPQPVLKQLPRGRYGHFTDYAIPGEVLRQSRFIGQVFTSLARENGSELTWTVGGETYVIKTVKDFAHALQASGHTIEWQGERTFANFISIEQAGSYVRWPAWFDTGIPLRDGHTLQVPMGHSQQAWLIHGPVVHARIAFYLGISGVGFFANTDERPSWTGMTASHFVAGKDAKEMAMVRKSFWYAAEYLKRVYKDLAGPALGRKHSGYGFLGVCNDSMAFVELALFGTRTTYPWVRSPSLIDEDSTSPVDLLLNQLPSDTLLTAEDLKPGGKRRRETLCRVQGMIPYRLEDARLPDPELLSDLKEVAEEVGDGC